jgi:hypothetical protein
VDHAAKPFHTRDRLAPLVLEVLEPRIEDPFDAVKLGKPISAAFVTAGMPIAK